MNKKSDSELIALARRGDKHAFGELLERYQQMVERIALGMVANPYLAQELAQEAMLQAYLSLEHLHDDQRFRSWLYGITLNVCRNYIRHQKIDVVSVRKQDADDGTISALVLLDEAGRRALGIWIGKAEAAAIDMGLRKTSLPRPMTMNFMANILQATGATLEEVRIATLKDDIFYATASIRNGQTVQELDARPSDAIALAVVTGSPVYAAEEVLEKAALTLPEGKTLQRMSLDRAGELAEGEPESGQPTASASKSQEECFKERFQRVLNMLMA